MLAGLFFYDGNLEDIVEEKAEFQIIDAKDGYTNNIAAIKKIMKSSVNHLVLTNQVVLLNKRWLWDKKTHEPKLYFKDKSDGKWKNVRRFTKISLTYNTNIEWLFRRGEFDREKAFNEKSKKQGRHTIKFTVHEKEGS